jgi:ABC-type multidrug transport system, ATPase component
MELQISNVTKKYAELYALQDFSVTFTNGVYGLLGPNGAGKTTLFNIILGIISQDSGKVCLDGIDIRKMGNAYYSHIGYLPQYTQFYKNYSCQEFLDYICVLKGQNKRIIKKKVSGLLELVNLQDVSKKKIGALSGGMRQRLGIAQALVNDPGILVLDEPTAGLDPNERIRLRNIISKFSKDRIVLLATHIVSDIEYVAKEVIIIDQGKLVDKGDSKSLTESVQNKVWTMEVTEEEINYLLETYSVGNVIPTEKGYRLKVVSEECPGENALPVSPTLEDVFLKYFGKTVDK